MNLRKFQYCLYIVMILLMCEINAHTEKTFRITDKVFRCSDWLSELLENLCSKVFKVVKRDTSLMEKLAPRDLQDHMIRQRLLSSTRWRRVRRQIASECCDQPCTVGNVIMYCSDTAKLVLEDPDIFDF